MHFTSTDTITVGNSIQNRTLTSGSNLLFQNCSGKDNCRKCLKSNGCAWHIGPTFAGCIDVNECDSREYGDGECFFGRFGCHQTCSTRAGDCEDCLGYDALGKGGRRGDCAWFVRDGERPQCIFHKRCDDRGFENGTCTRGRKGGDNSGRCNTPTSCDEITDCNECLESVNPFCAWAVHERIMDGKSKKCVDEARCDDQYRDDWSCYKGSVITDPQTVCKRIDRNPRDELCPNLNGFCSDCLKYDCSWNRDDQKCYDTCEDAPDGANCEPPPAPLDAPDAEAVEDNDGRSLLRFDSEESMLCFDWHYEDLNRELCHTAGENGDCETCTDTPQTIPPGVYYVQNPTCLYIPSTEECVAECPAGAVCQSTCGDDS